MVVSCVDGEAEVGGALVPRTSFGGTKDIGTAVVDLPDADCFLKLFGSRRRAAEGRLISTRIGGLLGAIESGRRTAVYRSV